MAVGGTLFGFFIAAIAIFFAGGVVFAAGPAAACSRGSGRGLARALLSLISIGLTNALVWYGGCTTGLLKPALEA